MVKSSVIRCQDDPIFHIKVEFHEQLNKVSEASPYPLTFPDFQPMNHFLRTDFIVS